MGVMRTPAEMKDWRTRQMAGAYNEIRQRLDFLIMATPTGLIREWLTEANIQVMRAEREWENAEKTRDTTTVSGRTGNSR